MKAYTAYMMSMVLLFAALPATYGLGLTSPFLGDSVHMYAGETMVVTFMLQNMVGDKNLKVKVVLLEGGEIAALMDGKEVYDVPFGRKDIPINIKIDIPKENPQSEYPIAFSVVTVPPSPASPLQLATGLEKRFKATVEAGERPAQSPPPQTEAVPAPTLEKPGITISLETQTILVAGISIVVIIMLFIIVKHHRAKHKMDRPPYEL